MVFQKNAALSLQDGLEGRRKHAKKAGKQDTHMDLGLLHVDRGLDRVAHCPDLEVKLVAGPIGLDLRAAGNMGGEVVDIVGNTPAGLVLAMSMRQVDFEGL